MSRMLIDETGFILCGRLSEANDLYTSLTGLMGKAELEEEEGLFLQHVPSIHTCFMKFSIDVIYLDSQMRVLDKETIKPWKLGKLVKGAVHTLELKEQRGTLFYAGQKLMILDEEKKGANQAMGDRNQALTQMNNLEEIKKQYENNDLDEQLKGCLIGGFNKKTVKSALESYRELLKWMQENFDSQLQEITSEKEKSLSECGILKRQLKDAVSKIQEIDELQAQYDSLKDLTKTFDSQLQDITREKEKAISECDNLKLQLNEATKKNQQLDELQAQYDSLKALAEDKDKEIKRLANHLQSALNSDEDLKKELPALQEEKRVLEDQYTRLKEDYDQLAAVKGVVGRDHELNKDVVKDLTRQLESTTLYCEVLEQQQATLERQLESMQTISQELEAITIESNNCKKDLRGYQKKYITIKRENDSLNGELESASRILTNILEQYEEKYAEIGILKNELAEQKQQVVKTLKEKLELQNTNVSLMEKLLAFENSKVIPFSASGAGEEKKAGQEDLNYVLNLARSTSERLSDMVAAKEEIVSKNDEQSSVIS